MKAINIKWDIDCKEDLDFLPTEIEIPEDIVSDGGYYEDAISDYISYLTGFCHYGFEIEE